MTLSQDDLPKLLCEALRDRIDGIEPADVTGVEPLRGGLSRLMFRFKLRRAEGTATYVLRADPPLGHTFSTNREHEYELIRWVGSATGIPTPKAHFYLPDSSGVQTNAIVLDHVDAPSLVAVLGSASEDEQRGMAARLCELAASIHTADLGAGALPSSLEVPVSWDRYIDDRIALLVESERAHPEPLPILRYVARWLAENRPPPVPLSLVHGDFETPNILVRADGSFCIVDWELARIGDPREDLGLFRVIAASLPPDLIGLDVEGFCARYRELTGLDECAVNPRVLAYFEILGMITAPVVVLPEIARFEAGGSDAISSAQFYRHLTNFQQHFMAKTVEFPPPARATKGEAR